MRIGQGFDVHRLVEGRKLIIGGVDIPYEKGLLGHSDADVLLHAVSDALLGAASLGDIGRHFADTDAQYENIDSRILLREVLHLVREQGYRVANVDATIIAAPSSTKNAQHARDPEMKQTKKGNQWYFGMKAHVAARGAINICGRCEFQVM